MQLSKILHVFKRFGSSPTAQLKMQQEIDAKATALQHAEVLLSKARKKLAEAELEEQCEMHMNRLQVQVEAFHPLESRLDDTIARANKAVEKAFLGAGLLCVLCFATVATGQDIHHAPTAEQCRADIAVWKGETKATIMSLPVKTLLQRSPYLHDCNNVLLDVKDFDGVDWSRMLEKVFMQHALQRALDFIDRHNLDPQFYDEDAKGAR
jgi:hypothetical protein